MESFWQEQNAVVRGQLGLEELVQERNQAVWSASAYYCGGARCALHPASFRTLETGIRSGL